MHIRAFPSYRQTVPWKNVLACTEFCIGLALLHCKTEAMALVRVVFCVGLAPLRAPRRNRCGVSEAVTIALACAVFCTGLAPVPAPRRDMHVAIAAAESHASSFVQCKQSAHPLLPADRQGGVFRLLRLADQHMLSIWAVARQEKEGIGHGKCEEIAPLVVQCEIACEDLVWKDIVNG